MKYLDTGARDPSQALAAWLDDVLNEDIVELRIQTGFFSIEGIGLLLPMLEQSKKEDGLVRMLIGSNDANTLRDDISSLIDFVGVPRANAQIGIVSFGSAYFHPKTYHMVRKDGTEAAFVGSANLTASGLALHVEAGISLDSREGDSVEELSQISKAIDSWFDEQRGGLTIVEGQETLDHLVETGVITIAPPPRVASAASKEATGSSTSSRPRLKPIFKLPRVATTEDIEQITVEPEEIEQPEPSGAQTIAPREGFPQYLLFDPEATGPTSGFQAMSGTQLPGGSVGLIIQLNKDSARHFMGGEGTANISIPVATIMTLRFGVFGKHSRPRAEFSMKIRYVGDEGSVYGGEVDTNIMGYGFTEGESGHGDIRMLVPKSVADLGELVTKSGMAAPVENDLALLEWPNPQDPSFRVTFLENGSPIAGQVSTMFEAAIKSGQLVGHGAAWLPAGISPDW